ncbi:IucA/IucC family C-terminal-domain containing protein [Bacillus sp. FJAT-45037]|uniref:IucA/IucC family C-terminal-domain containing protein n=1 Tax=Bacillus sp. FJAT-45037 TaxID=2011007 RepID=UPI0012FE779C|nr:IucA/IucC family C-terminal-domain containing protein [Bacillus sp. FJAT-45037]
MKLSADEINELEGTRVTRELKQTQPLSCDVLDLFNEEFLSQYMETVQKVVNAPDLLVAASIFSKRYSLIVTLPALLMMTRSNKQLEWNKELLQLSDSNTDQWWLPCMYSRSLSYAHWSEGNLGVAQKEEILRQIFADHLAPLWEKLHQLTNIPTVTLWENTFVYIRWFYEDVLTERALEGNVCKVKEDFRFICEAPGSIFGCKKNPLSTFYKNSMEVNSMRKTCCFAYRCSSDKTKCKSCPKV